MDQILTLLFIHWSILSVATLIVLDDDWSECLSEEWELSTYS